jgi:RNA polymerase sigma-70 factor (sigma-E family)
MPGGRLADRSGKEVSRHVDSAEEFTEFATAHAHRLRWTALLLCGDWHTAQDLTQITLASVFLAWRRIRPDSVPAYAHRTLVNSYLAVKRKRSESELPVAVPRERPAPAHMTELRLVLLQALATLTPKARAVVVLRYWEDLCIEQVAEVLGCSAGTVKSQSARALEKLRAHLGESLTELCSSD